MEYRFLFLRHEKNYLKLDKLADGVSGNHKKWKGVEMIWRQAYFEIKHREFKASCEMHVRLLKVAQCCYSFPVFLLSQRFNVLNYVYRLAVAALLIPFLRAEVNLNIPDIAMDSRIGLDYIVENREYVGKLAAALDTANLTVKKQVFELLSALCVYNADGYARTLDALEHFKTLKGTRLLKRITAALAMISRCMKVTSTDSASSFVSCEMPPRWNTRRP